ncbi:uncharacterized protein RSE6_02437 [Rhynchosporium secalis]|uniref:Uncharacterized protein n=1 Tax=Rhynchosporium secalis TaxID=38038 RepID=A0A1E1M098_RHYSE|nr:uncharacterized protein RSE6_02437 [Rhynchosporium secalis]
MPPLHWKNPVYAYTILAVSIAVLSQISLKSRRRIQVMETEVQACGDARKELKEEMEALREEMRRVREVDREEKLCLVETVKEVLRRGKGVSESEVMTNMDDVDEAYEGSLTQDTVPMEKNGEEEEGSLIKDTVPLENDGKEGEGLVVKEQIEDCEGEVEKEISCPWCAHAHQLRLGDCSGNNNCDGSVHVPYCPSCSYKDREDDSEAITEQESSEVNGVTLPPAVVPDDGEFDAPLMDSRIPET